VAGKRPHRREAGQGRRGRNGRTCAPRCSSDARTAERQPTAALTLAEVLDAILRDCERRERRAATSEFYKSHLGVIIKHFGSDRILSTILVGDVQEFLDARRKTVSGLTIKHDLMALKRAILYADIEPNPVKSMRIIRPKAQKRDPGLRLA
jgi:integrase